MTNWMKNTWISFKLRFCRGAHKEITAEPWNTHRRRSHKNPEPRIKNNCYAASQGTVVTKQIDAGIKIPTFRFQNKIDERFFDRIAIRTNRGERRLVKPVNPHSHSCISWTESSIWIYSCDRKDDEKDLFFFIYSIIFYSKFLTKSTFYGNSDYFLKVQQWYQIRTASISARNENTHMVWALQRDQNTIISATSPLWNICKIFIYVYALI